MPAETAPGRSARARLLALAGLVLFFALPIAGAALYHSQRMFVFGDLSGPDEATVLADAKPASWTAYRRDGAARLAILLTDENSAWLGLANGLKSLGVPFTITRDVREAVRHRVVLAYPVVSGRALPPEDLRVLAAHPRQGGTLIATNVLGGGLNEVFGFRDAAESRQRYELAYADETARWLGLDEPEERSADLGDRASGEAQLGTTAYGEPREALARFDDGGAAIVRRRFEGGVAYALGFDPGSLLLAGQNARGTDLERDYVNAYAPQGDVVLRMLRQIWREGEPLAISLGRVPDGRSLAAIMTFDVDFTRSLPNAEAYAEFLKSRDVRGTFFIQTKYLRDYNDSIMLTDATAAHLRRLGELGMELASHSVSHANAFRHFEMGDGTERYPDYRPVVVSRDRAEGGTILGELRVSKFLIETLAKPARVVSFRPGHLSNPPGLPQALEATGYRFSSSVTAGVSLTHLPFRLTRDRLASAETGVFEFPITVEDERDPLMGARLEQSLAVARKIARHGGLFVVLIHPNVLDHKLGFLRALVDRLKGEAWFGALEEFGRWWAARDRVELDVERRGDRLVARLAAPEAVASLTLETPAGWVPDPAAPTSRAARATARGILIERLEGAAEFVLMPRD